MVLVMGTKLHLKKFGYKVLQLRSLWFGKAVILRLSNSTLTSTLTEVAFTRGDAATFA